MVDLGQVSDLQLRQLIDDFPWFAAARCEYALRTGDDLRREGIFLISRSEWRQMISVKPAVRMPVEQPSPKPQYYVAGGDYFTKEDFNELEESGLAYSTPKLGRTATLQEIIAKSAVQAPAEPIDGDVNLEEFCTETLAEIYVQQEFYQRAIEVYEKLILLYPEKSIYFASLIEKVKNLKLS